MYLFLIVHFSVVVLRTVQLIPMSHFSHQFTVFLLFICLKHTVHFLCGLAFFSVGRILFMKSCSLRCGTVLHECQPGIF